MAIEADVAAYLRPVLLRLSAAICTENPAEIENSVNELVSARSKDMLSELQRLIAQVRVALDTFQSDGRLAVLAGDMPNARLRLEHVLTLTQAAAHQTLGLIEHSQPLVEVLAGAAGTSNPQAAEAARQLRRNLSDMLLAQAYQDLTGQIVQGVSTLIGELESALGGLAALAGEAAPQHARQSTDGTRAYGPVVPGTEQGIVVSDQGDVDALLSGLGL